MNNKYPPIEDLFSDINKIRIIRYFIRNPEGFFEKSEIAKRLGMRKNIFEKESKLFTLINFLKTKKSGKSKFYALNIKFYLYPEMKNLIERSISISDEELILKLKGVGRGWLALAAGIFINKEDSRADMMIVGKIKPSKLDKFIKFVEAKIGRELNFVMMTPEEFKYRHKMFDRFVHDMLESPHKKLISKIRL